MAMKKKWLSMAAGAVVLSFCFACTQKDQEEAQRKAEQAQQRTERAADRTGAEVKKLAKDTKRQTKETGRQLSHAALIGRIKSKLANDVGLSTITSVEVNEKSGTVTLQGRVSSAEQKREAQRVVMQIDGVKSVENLLEVRP